MIVTRSMYALIRAGRLGTMYVPPKIAKPWKPGRSYLALRVAEMIDEEREVRATDYSVTIIGVGDHQPIRDLVGHVAADPGYWQLVYPEVAIAHDDCVWVSFALGDWRDHTRFLAGRPGRVRFKIDRGTNRWVIDTSDERPDDDRGYTGTPFLALDPDAEPVDDEYLKRFVQVADPFIREKQIERQARRERAKAARSRTRH
jgi:hypothetical protein